MIRRFNRYPLVIDPSGQATEFIMNEYRGKKITKTRWEKTLNVCGGGKGGKKGKQSRFVEEGLGGKVV